jgi:hypothetical protein
LSELLATANQEMIMLLNSASRSFSDARTRSTESMSLQSELRSRFLSIFSLLKAPLANALDTNEQQNMLTG